MSVKRPVDVVDLFRCDEGSGWDKTEDVNERLRKEVFYRDNPTYKNYNELINKKIIFIMMINVCNGINVCIYTHVRYIYSIFL